MFWITEFIWAYLAVGVFAGIAAGLFGVGGGLIIVPVLALVFSMAMPYSEFIVHTAVGTSLATIVVTAISATLAHHRRGAVLWDDWVKLAPGLMVGAFSGALLADFIPDAGLSRIFGVFELLVAAWLLLNVSAKPSAAKPRFVITVILSWCIGCVSSVVGIGGGTMTVPLLVWSQRTMQQAVATSSACGLPIATAGAIGFMLTGLDETGGAEGSLGYVYWPAAIVIMVASASFAPLGAYWAHQLSARRLRMAFALLLISLGIVMLLS